MMEERGRCLLLHYEFLFVYDDDHTIDLRTIKPGMTSGNLVEVTGNLKPGERVVTKGSLFIDRSDTG